MQDRLGVAVGLGAAEEDQVAGRLEGERAVEIRRHRPVERVAGVLPVDHRRHPLHRLHAPRSRVTTP